MIPASIPSPPLGWSSFSVGPLTVHAYALFILAGIFFAIWFTTRRWVERGGTAEVVGSVAFWAVPFGIIGARIYHLITSPQAYFGEGGNPADALRIWNGGLGIWGAVAFGLLGAYIGCRRHNVSFVTFIDAAAPAVLVAQAIGRIGNYFNQELFGSPTTLPWALQIDPAFRPAGYEQFETFHPTFAYEMIWALLGAWLIVYVDKRLDLRGGRVFWLYVIVYTSGRLWIEMVRIDDATLVWGIRVNILVSALVLASAIVIYVWLGKRQRAAGTHVPREQLAAATTTAPAAITDAPEGDEPATTASASEPGPDVADEPATASGNAAAAAAPATATKKPAVKKPAATKTTATAAKKPATTAAKKPVAKKPATPAAKKPTATAAKAPAKAPAKAAAKKPAASAAKTPAKAPVKAPAKKPATPRSKPAAKPAATDSDKPPTSQADSEQ